MLSGFVSAALAADVNVALPGPYDLSTTGPVGAIGNIYFFAIGLGGLLAFIAITYAGIKWMLARGNPSGISDAKDQIVQALLGLVLLFGAYIILNTINPELTVLQIPKLTEFEAASSTANALCLGASNGYCPATYMNCVDQRAPGAPSPDYKCVLKLGLKYVCSSPDDYDPLTGAPIPGVIKFCYDPAVKKKQECNIDCINAVGPGNYCSNPENNPGCP
ncbi:MAG: hypothetical protein Q7S36_01960 [Candidatus Liptonbacteria bacterium]|nr:hypothetical protein [Candidatus Liptonbacteria bacterium]